MEKSYFTYLNLEDFAAFFLYAVLFYLFLGFLMRFLKFKSKQVYFIVSIFFAAYHLLLFADFHFDFIPYLPDSDQYYFLFDKGFAPEKMPSSLKGLLAIMPLLSLLLCGNILAYISLQITLYFIAVLILIKSWELLYNVTLRNTFLQFSLFLCLIMPASVLFSLVPLRESFSTFAFSLALYFLTLLFKKAKSMNFGLPLSMLLIFFTRMQVIFYFIISLVGIKVILDKNIARKIAIVFIGISMLLIFLVVTNYQLSPGKLEYARNYRVENYTGTYGKVEWNSYKDIVVSAPKLMTQFLLSPFPILHNKNPIDMKLAFIDALLILFFSIVLILNFPILLKKQTYWLLLILIYLFLFGIYEFNIGGAVRHRLPMVLMMAIVVAERFTVLYAKKNHL